MRCQNCAANLGPERNRRLLRLLPQHINPGAHQLEPDLAPAAHWPRMVYARKAADLGSFGACTLQVQSSYLHPHRQSQKLPPSTRRTPASQPTSSSAPLARPSGYPKQRGTRLPESWSLREGLRKETCFGKPVGEGDTHHSALRKAYSHGLQKPPLLSAVKLGSPARHQHLTSSYKKSAK